MDGTICLCGSSAEMVAGRPLTWAHSCRTGCVAATLNLHSVFRVADVILHTLVEGTVL